MPQTLTGGCLCGEIRYIVDAPIERLVACYCTDCQHITGAGGSISAFIPAASFKIVKGQTKVFTRQADSGNLLHRHFCGNCGSWIYNPRGSDPGSVVLKAGTLDQREGMRITLNIWTRSRPAWAPIDTSVPSWPMGRPPTPTT